MSISTEKLIALRKERGWSQEKLAAIAGVSERTIQRAEGEGTCSLDTKMALASAFDVSPSEFSSEAQVNSTVAVAFKTSWSGCLGLLVLGLLAPIIVLLTATNGKWEMMCIGIVLGLTIALTAMSYGAKATYKLFDCTSWIVRYPTYVNGLNTYIIQAESVIEYSYIVGVVASLVYALTIAVHVPSEMNDTLLTYITSSIRPLVYSVLFSELWFRPFQKRMDAMLMAQQEKSKN